MYAEIDKALMIDDYYYEIRHETIIHSYTHTNPTSHSAVVLMYPEKIN